MHFLCHEYRELLWKSQWTSGDIPLHTLLHISGPIRTCSECDRTEPAASRWVCTQAVRRVFRWLEPAFPFFPARVRIREWHGEHSSGRAACALHLYWLLSPSVRKNGSLAVANALILISFLLKRCNSNRGRSKEHLFRTCQQQTTIKKLASETRFLSPCSRAQKTQHDPDETR